MGRDPLIDPVEGDVVKSGEMVREVTGASGAAWNINYRAHREGQNPAAISELCCTRGQWRDWAKGGIVIRRSALGSEPANAGPPSASAQAPESSSSALLVAVGAVGLVIAVVSVLASRSRSSAPAAAASSPAVVQPAPPAFVPYSERVKQAQAKLDQLKDYARTGNVITLDELKDPRALLGSIPKDDASRIEADKVSAAVDSFEKETRSKRDAAEARKAAATAASEKALGLMKRQSLAQSMQHEFLMKDMDATITTEGKEATTLRFKYVLVGRPLVEQIQTDGAFLDRCRTAGFKKVILEDGFGKSWTFNL